MNKPYSKFGQAYISYGNYHHNLVNKWIHTFSIPLMTAAVLAMLSLIPFSLKVSGRTFGVADAAFTLLLVYYASLSMTFAAAAGAVAAGGAVAWKAAFEGMEHTTYVKWIIGLFVFSWIISAIGHRIFEKRKQNSLENIKQALSAPLFTMVILFDTLGLRTDEMQQWEVQIDKNVKEYWRTKGL